MTTISAPNLLTVTPPGLPSVLPSPATTAASRLRSPSSDPSDQLREMFTQFVGETFYGQMIKAMRSTVGKPAYFHGGRGEEVFRSQLDQALAEHMTAASAERFAEPMFQRQFPHLSRQAASSQATEPASQHDRLEQLPRR